MKSFINWYCGTSWHKWWVEKVWKPSWSKFLNLLMGLPSLLVLLGQELSKLAGDDKIANLLQQMHVPDGVFVGLAVVSLIGYIAASH